MSIRGLTFDGTPNCVAGYQIPFCKSLFWEDRLPKLVSKPVQPLSTSEYTRSSVTKLRLTGLLSISS